MLGELTLEERAALDHAAQVLHDLAETRYGAGLTALGDDAEVSQKVIRRLLARDLQNTD